MLNVEGSGFSSKLKNEEARENLKSALVSEILASRAVQQRILAKTGADGVKSNSELFDDLVSEIMADLDGSHTVEIQNDEKILLELALERIRKRDKYSKLGLLLLFFCIYVSALLLRNDQTDAFSVESRSKVFVSAKQRASRPQHVVRRGTVLCTAVQCPPFQLMEPEPQISMAAALVEV